MIPISISKKTIFIIAGGIVLSLALVLLTTLLLKENSGSNEKMAQDTSTSPFTDLHFSNSTFVEGSKSYSKGDYQKAIEYYELSKEKVSIDEKAVIDISIAHSAVEVNRLQGVEVFVKVAKEESYKKRFRSLAMIYAYLVYSKYSDVSVLRYLAKSYDIPWTNRGEVTNNYMKKAYELYPFGYSAVKIASYDLDSTKTKDEAGKVFEVYIPVIESSISQMKRNPGEQVILTSTMLAKANLLGRFFIEHNLSSKKEVELAYEDLINYSNSLSLNVNKEYAMLSYANFLSGAKDYKKSEEIITLMQAENMSSALKESLPKMNLKNLYPYLEILKANTKDKKVLEFLNFIGSSLKK